MYSGDFRVKSDNDMKCVWMTSGIISYKLCSLDFFCEECLFDKVMHNVAVANNQRQDIDGSAAPEFSSAGSLANRLDGSLFYHKNHCWVKVVNPDEVVIGINGILSKLMYGI